MQGQVRKRGNKWVAIVYAGRDPETNRKRYKWYTRETRHDAQVVLTQLLTQAETGKGLPSTRLLVSNYLDQWVRDYAKVKTRPTTCQSYEEIVNKHLKPTLGHYRLATVAAPAIQAYIGQKLKDGLSPTTVHYHGAVLRRAFSCAVKWGLLMHNPMSRVELPAPAEPEKHVWDIEQVRLFLGAAKQSSPYYALYLMAATTGMREGELLGLRWRDVNFLTEEVYVQQTFYRMGGEQLFHAPKTERGRRLIPLVPQVIGELRDINRNQAKRKLMMGAEYQDHDLVFCQADGKPLHAHNIVRRDFHPLAKGLGLPRIRFHDLRHSHATHLYAQGENPKVVQERLGHATVAFTLKTYGEILPQTHRDAVRRLGRQLAYGGGAGNSRGIAEDAS